MDRSDFKLSDERSALLGSISWIFFLLLSTFVSIYFIILRKTVLKESKKVSLSSTVTGIVELLDAIRNFASLCKGDGEVMLDKIVKILGRYESPHSVNLGVVHFVYVNKPEDLQIVLNNSNSLGKGKFYDFFKVAVGEGLMTAPVPKWKKRRRLISPIFNATLLENFFPVFNNKSRCLVNKLKKACDTSEVIDLWEDASTTSLDTICENAMGFDSNSSTRESEIKTFQEVVVRVSQELSLRIYKLWLHPNFIFQMISKINGTLNDLKEMQILPKKIIKYKEERLNEQKPEMIVQSAEKGTSEKMTTFLDTLFQLNNQGAQLTNEDIYDEVVTFMIAGSETTAITLCLTSLMLAMHPHVQSKAYSEVMEVLGEEDRFINMDDVQNMPYLEQCIKETIRLFPNGPFLLRETTGELMLNNNFVVQKGVTIVYSPMMVHRNPEIYPNPMVWSPDNFAPEEVEKRHRYSFLGFSGGPRGCVGQKYALLSLKVSMSLILKNYYLTTDVKLSDIKLKIDLLLRSVDGYKVKLHSRRPK